MGRLHRRRAVRPDAFRDAARLRPRHRPGTASRPRRGRGGAGRCRTGRDRTRAAAARLGHPRLHRRAWRAGRPIWRAVRAGAAAGRRGRGEDSRESAALDVGQFRRPAAERHCRAHRQPLRFRRRELRRRRGLRRIARGGAAGGAGAGDRTQRPRGLRQRGDRPGPVRLSVLQQRAGDVGERSVPHLRRGGRRHRDLRRCGDAGAEASGGRRSRRRPHLRRHQGRRRARATGARAA